MEKYKMDVLPTTHNFTIEDAHKNGFKLLSMYKLWHWNECVFTTNQEFVRSIIQEMKNELDERFIELPTDINKSTREILECELKSYYILVYSEKHKMEHRTIYKPIGLLSKNEVRDILQVLSYIKESVKMIKVTEEEFQDYIYLADLNEAALKLLKILNYKDENYDKMYCVYDSIYIKQLEIRKKIGLKYNYEIVKKVNKDVYV